MLEAKCKSSDEMEGLEDVKCPALGEVVDYTADKTIFQVRSRISSRVFIGEA